jgi:hypothetical protein
MERRDLAAVGSLVPARRSRRRTAPFRPLGPSGRITSSSRARRPTANVVLGGRIGTRGYRNNVERDQGFPTITTALGHTAAASNQGRGDRPALAANPAGRRRSPRRSRGQRGQTDHLADAEIDRERCGRNMRHVRCPCLRRLQSCRFRLPEVW